MIYCGEINRDITTAKSICCNFKHKILIMSIIILSMNIMISRLRRIVFLILIIFTHTVQAANYYVDTNHPAASDQNSGTIIGQPWKTIVKANQAVKAGDTVFIKSGTYNSFISPVNSGKAGASIVYMNFSNDKVIISDTAYGILLDGKSYITVYGINFYHLDKFLYIQNGSNYNTIAFCAFDQARMTNGRTVTWAGSVIKRNSKHNWIHHCRFSKYGYFTHDDISCIMDIGDENITTDYTSHNLIENCSFFHAGHHVLGVYGMYNVIRNNYIHNEPWSMGTSESDRGAVLYGNRNVSVSGYIENSGRNLFEGNRIAYSGDPSDNRGASGMSLTTSYNIVRFNLFYYNDMAGLTMSVTRSYCQDIVNNKIYNNTFLHNYLNEIGPKCGIAFAIYSGNFIIKFNSIKNNLFFGHPEPFGTFKVNLDDQIFAGNWDGDKQGAPRFINASLSPGDPMDPDLPDLRLLADSPCKDKGTYLTTIISPAGSGFSFTVADAGYFTDGWGIKGVQGDEIQLYQNSQKARIIKVDYKSNNLLLDRNVKWEKGQGISLSYYNKAPDPGALE